jgi:hypothetical protein
MLILALSIAFNIPLGIALGIALGVAANAAPAHHPRARPHAPANSSQGVATPGSAGRIAVPGWSEEDTRRWLDSAGSLWRGA